MNSKTINKILHLLLILCAACATRYDKLGKNGGYTDTKINDHVYKISFQGNTRTSDTKVRQYFMRRCAEIAFLHHFPYFVIIESSDITKYTTVVSEGTPLTKAKVTAISYSERTEFTPTVQKNIPKHLIEGTIALYKEGEQPANSLKVEEVLKNTSSQIE